MIRVNRIAPFGRILLQRSWRQCLCLFVFISVGGVFSRYSPQGLALNACLLIFVLISVFAALAFTESHQNSASGYPNYLYLLPVSDVELVALPMVLSAAVLALAGGTISTLLLNSPAHAFDSWWIAPYLAGNVSVFQAVTWIPLRRPELRYLLAVAIIASAMVGPLLVGTQALGSQAVSVLYGLLCIVSITVCVRSVGRARHGLEVVASKHEALQIPDLGPFSSKVESQVWLESRRNGFTMKVISGLFAGGFALVAPLAVLDNPMFIDLGATRISQMALILAFLNLAISPLFGFGGCCASEPDNIAKDRSLVPFLALRPLSTIQVVEAKLLMSIRMAVRIGMLSLAVSLAILLLPTSTIGNYRPTIVPLVQLISIPRALGMLAAYGVLLLYGVKGAISNIWLSLGRLPRGLSIALAVIPFVTTWCAFIWLVVFRADDIPRFLTLLPNMIYLVAFLKTFALIPTTLLLYRSRLVPHSLILKWGIGCAVAWCALFGLACLALPEGTCSRCALASQAFVMLPLVRVALAPLAVHRGRHA